MRHRNFKCWISVDNRPLTEYALEENGKLISAWIPSVVGKNFSVSWRNTRPQLDEEEQDDDDYDDGRVQDTSGHIFVDGQKVASGIARRDRAHPVARLGAKDSSKTLKRFIFAPIKFTDDDSLANRHDPSLKDFGTIRVEIYRVRLGQKAHFEPYDVTDNRVVHERAKKVGAHVVEFGPTKRTEGTRTDFVTTTKLDDAPWVTFVFKYRSLDILKAHGITQQLDMPEDDVVVISSDSEDDDEASPRKRVKLEHSSPDPSQSMPTTSSPVPSSSPPIQEDMDDGHSLNGDASELFESAEPTSSLPPSSDPADDSDGDLYASSPPPASSDQPDDPDATLPSTPDHDLHKRSGSEHPLFLPDPDA